MMGLIVKASPAGSTVNEAGKAVAEVLTVEVSNMDQVDVASGQK